MNMKLSGFKECRRGFTTIEILLAMALMVLALTAAVLMSFGGQSLAADAQASEEALALAHEMIKNQRELAKKDFRLVNPTSDQDGIFKRNIMVTSIPFFLKNVAARVSWNVDGREQKIELSTLISDFNDTAGNDTCDSYLTGDWGHPIVKKVIDLFDYAESASSTYAISDVDAYKGRLYVSIGKTANKTDSTFFVFDISDPFAPVRLAQIDNNPAAAAGINAVAVNGKYAYVASAGSKQFKIIDVGIMPPQIVYEYKITGGGDGQSIFYKGGYINLGLAKKANVPEFYIFNVVNLSGVYLESSFLVGAGVNDIYVKKNYVYLAHPADLASGQESGREQLTVLDILNPDAPQRVSGFYYDGSMGGHGKSLHLVGDRLYLGRTTSHILGPADTIPEFFIIDNSNPTSIPSAAMGSFALSAVDSANGVLARDYLAFLLGRTSMKVFKIDDPPHVSQRGEISFNANASEDFEPSFDCEGNNFFVGSNVSGRGYISIITAE
jgi:hypothetical protein